MMLRPALPTLGCPRILRDSALPAPGTRRHLNTQPVPPLACIPLPPWDAEGLMGCGCIIPFHMLLMNHSGQCICINVQSTGGGWSGCIWPRLTFPAPPSLPKPRRAPAALPPPAGPRNSSGWPRPTFQDTRTPSRLILAAHAVPFPYRAWPTPPPLPTRIMDDAPRQCPSLHPVPSAQVTTAFLLHSSLLPKKRSLLPPARKPARHVCPPWLLVLGPPSTSPELPSSSPGEQGALSKPPHPRAGRQRRARASLEPLGCLLRLPTAAVPGEVSKASDPRTGMRKASSKQSQLPAPAQGGWRGESSRPRTARHSTARHSPDTTARP
ncbi:proline-rich receptor-like protein kinase PERK9 isoform X2 [Motacilla alba alba]|uniref:proline-rich receptor-like protein kinase PERK9 isoform X2 n=1 Tax=Motacilla alba alba TaxID=1094192 RepID=UPI0018D4F43F|nr:proline-rich receptor-like protein kinase PERK9 isoform X2 [Motacilla alba alba]XP_038016669.1 proline-rich receptor-like protein kinase PERK9 isoform X2 [Motacilla alba alba]